MGDKIVIIHEDSATVVGAPSSNTIVTTTPDTDVVVDPQPPVTQDVILKQDELFIGPAPIPSVKELFDSAIQITQGPYPKLRFERDMDGDVQYIYLATED